MAGAVTVAEVVDTPPLAVVAIMAAARTVAATMVVDMAAAITVQKGLTVTKAAVPTAGALLEVRAGQAASDAKAAQPGALGTPIAIRLRVTLRQDFIPLVLRWDIPVRNRPVGRVKLP